MLPLSWWNKAIYNMGVCIEACHCRRLLAADQICDISEYFKVNFLRTNRWCSYGYYRDIKMDIICRFIAAVQVHSTLVWVDMSASASAATPLLPARRRPQGLVVIGVCLSVCLCVRTVFVRKISQERVHGLPPSLVGGSRGWTSRTSSILVLIGFRTASAQVLRLSERFLISL